MDNTFQIVVRSPFNVQLDYGWDASIGVYKWYVIKYDKIVFSHINKMECINFLMRLNNESNNC